MSALVMPRCHCLTAGVRSTLRSPGSRTYPSTLHLLAPQVLYLVLVQFMDSRGGELQPPPPEAFGL